MNTFRVVRTLPGDLSLGAIYSTARQGWYVSPIQTSPTSPTPVQQTPSYTPDPRTSAWTTAQAEADRKAAIAASEGQARLDRIRAESDAALARSRAQIAAREAAIKAASSPAADAGIQEWETYYRSIGKTLTPTQTQSIQRREKADFYKQTSGRKYLSDEIGAISRVGVGLGVTWMFATAYNGDMPYWDLWFDGRATAYQIAQMVASDYTKEILRRDALQKADRAATFAWEDAGKIGPPPSFDPNAGMEATSAPVTLPGMPISAPQQPPTTAKLAIPKLGANLREWEAYYASIGRAMTPVFRASIELREKSSFYEQTFDKKYISDEVGAITGTRVRPGVRWMYEVAYNGDMPYWALLHDRHKSADQIAQMVASDYTKEILRRDALKTIPKPTAAPVTLPGTPIYVPQQPPSPTRLVLPEMRGPQPQPQLPSPTRLVLPSMRVPQPQPERLPELPLPPSYR